MHPKIERLAELADPAGEEADAELQAHVEACTSCQAQLSQLHRLVGIGSRRLIESSPERGGHITDEEIIGYVNIALNPDKQAHIKRHLHACGQCMKEVLLYRSHVAQARLAQSTATVVDNKQRAWAWQAKLSAWVRGLFHFSMPATLWIVMVSIMAPVVVMNRSWFSELGAPTTNSAQALENNIAIPAVALSDVAAVVTTVPENPLASGQEHDNTTLNLPHQEKSTTKTAAATTAPVATTTPLSQFRSESAVAVIIGNKSYTPGSVIDAKYALQDAQGIKTWLVSALGVSASNIIYIENATSAQFNEVFGSSDNPAGRLAAAVKPGVSDVFIYYSGHGAPDLGSKRAYFVPADTDPRFIALSGYAVDTFFNNLAQLSARSVMVVLDTNFSGHSAGGTLLKNVSPALIKTEQSFPKLANLTIFSGASQGQVNAWYDDQSHSLFTYLFLKGAAGSADNNRDGSISALELQKYLQQAVPYEARRLGDAEQTPVLTQIQDRVLVNVR